MSPFSHLGGEILERENFMKHGRSSPRKHVGTGCDHKGDHGVLVSVLSTVKRIPIILLDLCTALLECPSYR